MEASQCIEKLFWQVMGPQPCCLDWRGPCQAAQGWLLEAIRFPAVTPRSAAAQVGGYQLHQVQGAVGGAKGVGLSTARTGNTAAAAGADPKRKRDGDDGTGGKGAGLSKEEQEFMARREAARQRVQQRTAATFGLG